MKVVGPYDPETVQHCILVRRDMLGYLCAEYQYLGGRELPEDFQTGAALAYHTDGVDVDVH
jgi:hypothetical protein